MSTFEAVCMFISISLCIIYSIYTFYVFKIKKDVNEHEKELESLEKSSKKDKWLTLTSNKKAYDFFNDAFVVGYNVEYYVSGDLLCIFVPGDYIPSTRVCLVNEKLDVPARIYKNMSRLDAMTKFRNTKKYKQYIELKENQAMFEEIMAQEEKVEQENPTDYRTNVIRFRRK